MRSLLALALFAALGSVAVAATISVPDDYATIQGAVDASANGDTIIVRPGTYVENIDFRGKAIILKSEYGPGLTIIDGGSPSDPGFGCAVGFFRGEGPDSVLDGFTLTNGTGSDCGWSICGGGAYCDWASPVISNNIIANNTADNGGGISCDFSTATIRGNVVVNNSAANGGGIWASYSTPLIEGNVIGSNDGPIGGGGIFSAYQEPGILEIKNNTVADNTGGFGGGLYCFGHEGSRAVIIGNVIRGNSSDYGGGIVVSEVCASITGDTVHGNSAIFGGGLQVDTFDGIPMILSNNLIYKNSAVYGGGVSCSSSKETIWIINNTITDNSAHRQGGIDNFGCSLVVANTILWNNLAPIDPEMGPNPYAYYSDVKGGCPGPGNIDVDPEFVDPDSADYHLMFGSACVSAGNSSLQHLPSTDFEGGPRIGGGAVDMGADEFYFRLYHAGEASPGGTMDFRVVGGPGMPVLLGHSATLQDPPQPTAWGDLFLTVPATWSSNIGTIPANGVLNFPVAPPSFWHPGDEKYFQALVGAPGGPHTTFTNFETIEVE